MREIRRQVAVSVVSDWCPHGTEERAGVVVTWSAAAAQDFVGLIQLEAVLIPEVRPRHL